jgi:hypothetical protein
MKYDRDLKWLRRVILLVIASNLGFAIAALRQREWIHAIGGCLWAVNCWVTSANLKSAQKTRDEIRLAASVLLRLGDDG